MTGRTGSVTRRTGPAPSRNDGRGRAAVLGAVLLAALLPALLLTATGAGAAARSAADPKPVVTLSQKQAGKGGEVTVRGTGWRPGTLLMMLVCGQSTPRAA